LLRSIACYVTEKSVQTEQVFRNVKNVNVAILTHKVNFRKTAVNGDDIAMSIR
jgi:hypothetical protein